MAAPDGAIELTPLKANSDSINDVHPHEEDGESDHDVKASTDGAQAAPPPPPMPPRRHPGLTPRPKCTHIVMDYLYTTKVLCDNCSNPPRLGWLYVCQQVHYSQRYRATSDGVP